MPQPASPNATSYGPATGLQAEKSASTRARILQASVECLIDLGYSGFTTVEVVERAGVSRGAMLHHYPSKADILSATMEFLHLKRLASLRDGVRRFSADVDVVDAAVSLFWAMVRDPHYAAMQELKVAARTDPELRGKLSPISDRYELELRRSAGELFSGYVREGAPLAEMEDVAAHMFEGLGMARNLKEDDSFAESTLRFFKALIRELLLAPAVAAEHTEGINISASD